MKIITCVAPVNIAVIKYWGKRNSDLILPINDSISATLSLEHMCAKTTIMVSPNLKENRFWLNGKEENFENPRLTSCLKEIKSRAQSAPIDFLDCNIHVCSENNFPTAAGLASSAAGYACLVFALASLYEIQGDISAIARRGSGSACRSVLGGWVRWYMGSLNDGSDSIAKEIAPVSHWPEMRVLVLVVNDNRKKLSSTSAMKRSVETSDCLIYRTEKILPKRVEEMTNAIKNKNFEEFAKLTMQDSNQFHAICLDTFPPCVYMNDTSHAIVELVHAYNSIKSGNVVAYTFDAGPNACLYMLERNISEFLSLLNYIFPTETDPVEYVRGIPINHISLSEDIKQNINQLKIPEAIKFIIHTKVGEGPKILNDPTEHLLNEAGLPKNS